MAAGYTIIGAIREQQLKWYGHMRRMNDGRIPLKVWKWIPVERTKRGPSQNECPA